MSPLATQGRVAPRRALLLGGGELGKEIAIEAMRLGVELTVAERYPHSPAAQIAHHEHVVELRDPHALDTLLRQLAPELVFIESEAIAIAPLFEAEARGAQIVPSAKSVEICMNRAMLRDLATSLGLPTAPSLHLHTFDALQHAVTHLLPPPCYIKPLQSSSGKGQTRLEPGASPEALRSAWERARTEARSPDARGVLLEAAIDLEAELTLLAARTSQGLFFCDPVGHVQRDGDYQESWQPAEISEETLQEAQRQARVMLAALPGRGVFGVELFLTAQGVLFSELSPRPHDTGMVTLITQDQSEFELHVRAALDLLPSPPLRWCAGASAVLLADEPLDHPTHHLTQPSLAEPGLKLRFFGKPTAHAGRRMGIALATSTHSAAHARQRARELAARHALHESAP